MAEKKPMSLNERHKHHLLSSQSRSVARPDEMKPNLQKVKVEGRRRLCKAVANNKGTMNVNLDEPNFSGIMDFDSPPPPVSRSVGVKDRDRTAIDAPSFGGIMDFDSPVTKIIEDRPNSAQRSGLKHLSNKEETVGARDSDSAAFDAPSFGGIMDFDTPVKNVEDYESTSLERSHEKEEAISGSTSEYEEAEDDYDDQEGHGDTSVHLIVSSNSQDSVSGNASEFEEAEEDRSDQTQEEEVERDSSVHFVMSSNSQEEEKPRKIKLEGRRRLCKVEPKENKDREITCLDTPLASDESKFKGVVDLDSPPEKIRDILDDLSSKLEFMSIEKKTTVNKVEKVPDSALSKLMERCDSPGSSFSVSPDPSVLLTDLAVKHKTQIVEKEVKGDEVFSFSAKYSTQVEEKKPKGDRGNSFSAKYSSQIAEKDTKGDRLFNFAAKDKTQTAKEEREDDKFFYHVDYAKKADHVKKTERDYGVKKTEKSVSRESFTVVSDDDEDPYMFLSNANSSRKPSSRRTNCLKEDAKDSVFGTPKDSAGGDWVFEDGESIILTGKPFNYNLPGKIAKMLYPHQQSGLRWLWSLHCKGTGGILGDDMGLGKTMQICSFLAGLFHSRLVKRVLVVAPKTLLTHWIKELTVVGLSEKIREYYGTCAKARQYELQYIFQDSGILLTTYDIVRNNYKSLRGDSYFLDDSGEDLITWDYIILDEGHIIKNPSTQRAKSLLEIPSDHRIIISGTPIQNNLKELWALFSFCCPELLGDKKEFKLKYESPILRGNEKNATDREKRIGSAVAKEFRERIEPYFLRRLKSEVFLEDDQTKSSQISKKNELIVWLRLTQSQRQLYEAFLNSELVLSSFDGSPLAALTVLKKICDHPYLLTKRAAEDVLEGMEAMVNQDELGILERMALHLANASDSENFQDLIDNVSCKLLHFLLSLLDNLIPDGHNVLIFSQTRKMLNFVQEAIISRGHKFLRIDGTTKISDREKIVKDFQEGEGAPIFLLTSQVGGLGLTLTKADRVIVVDPAWNPSTDNQSVDRAYRIGQKKDVIVYRLMTCGTIEEKIYKMQVFKGGLFKTATEHKEQTRYFSQQDLRELFSLPKEGFDVSVTQRQLAEEHDQQHIMDASLKKHIEFLESHDISGVSHHSLLFSKTAPTPPLEEQEVARRKESTFVGSSSSSASVERIVDGAAFAFNPKEVKARGKCTIDVSPNKSTESEIRDRLERLHQMYANKGMISKLPDKGEKLKRQIADLSFELEKISMSQDSVTEIVNLDEISGKLQRVHV